MAALQSLLADSPALARAVGSLSHPEKEELRRLYDLGAYAPLWVDGTGRPAASTHQALALFAGAAADGFESADYDYVRLSRLTAALGDAQRPLAHDVAVFDVSLSSSVLRYFRHLHLGRVDPRAIGFRSSMPAERHDFVQQLRAALLRGRITETAAELMPPLMQYRALRTMLARYRALIGRRLEAPPATATSTHPGEPYVGLRVLHRLLVAFGDVPPNTPVPTEGAAYEGTMVEGVKRFQLRHGLEPDGILGRATRSALSVPVAWRVRQIELALERLRWLPDLRERGVLLNIPMFRLWAWDSAPPDGEPSLAMRAIVGRALRTQTPMLVGEMRFVIFRPYWNVPRSILRNEILPVLERDLAYLERQDMEMVQGSGDDARVVAATPENLALLEQGQLRLRQRPGPRNALGLIKFVFPNVENVYLHGTPAQELFGRSRRDFSHGCVRVEEPVALAEWVLAGLPEGRRDWILAAMSGSDSRSVTVPRPIQVILFYLTAIVAPEDGTIHFAEDIYGHDTKLDRVLGRLQPVE